MKKNTTLVDIANKLSIDVSTVSKALKGHPKISSSTKEKVAKVARELNYYPNKIAAALVNGTSNLIGVMVPQTDENFFSSVIRGIEEIAKKRGYHIIIFQSNDNYKDEIENIEIMLQAKVDGVLASHAMETTHFDHYKRILDQGVPLIFFDRFNESIDTDVIAIDDFKGAYKAVAHLIEQGCKNIAYIGGDKKVHIYRERYRGYKEALLDHDLPFREELAFESDTKLKEGQKYTKELLKNDPTPDAIFAASDYTAIGVLKTLGKHNIKVPEEVAVVGFSNEDFCSFVTPSLTSVNQHSREMGQSAANQLLNRLKQKKDEIIPKKTILTSKLIVRASSLRPK